MIAARRALLTGGVPLVMACSFDEDDVRIPPSPDRPTEGPTSVLISDSPSDLPVWVVGEELFSVQADEESATAAPFLQLVRGGHWLRDGRVLVVDGLVRMHLYDDVGTYIGTYGGRGEGPSEFGFIRTVTITPEDSIVAYDALRRAVKVFHPDLGFSRSEVIDMPEGVAGNPQVLRLGRDYLHLGSDLEGLDVVAALRGLRPGEIASIRETAVLHVLSGGRVRAGPIRFPGASSGLVGDMSVQQPLAAEPQVASRDDMVVYSPGDRFRVVQLNTQLETRRVIDWPAFSMTFEAGELDSVRRRMLDDNVSERMIDIMLSDEMVPDVRPSIQRLMVDRQCRIWASRFEARLRTRREREWIVLDPVGAPIARLVLPSEDGVQLLDVDGDRMLLGRLGPLGEPSVQAVRIGTEGSVDPGSAGVISARCSAG